MKKIKNLIMAGACALAVGAAAVLAGNGLGGEAEPVKATSTTTLDFDFTSQASSWGTTFSGFGLRVADSSSLLVGTGTIATRSTTYDDFVWETLSSNAGTVTVSTDNTIVGLQIYLTSNFTAYIDVSIAAGSTYKITLGSWDNTNSWYGLNAVNESSSGSVTIAFTDYYVLDSDYYSVVANYTTDSTNYYNVYLSTDGVASSGLYTYKGTIASAVYGTQITMTLHIVTKVGAAASETWAQIYSGITFTPTASSLTSTTDVSNSAAFYNAYNQGLMTAWCKTFLTAYQNDGSTFTGICASDGSTATADIKSNWTTLSATYPTDSNVTAYFTGATAAANNASYLQAAKALYSQIYSVHGTALSLTDFASLTSGSLNQEGLSSSTLSSAIIILALASLAGASFFIFYRRKKND